MSMTVTSVFDTKQEGYTINSVDISDELSLEFYNKTMEVGETGVPGAEIPDDEKKLIIDSFKEIDKVIKEMISSNGGDISMPYRVRHTDKKLDFFVVHEVKEV